MEQIIEFAQDNFFLSGIWLALIILILYTYIAGALSPVKELNTHEATLKINKEDAVLLDIRKQEEFKKGHIVGARQIKSSELESNDFSKLEKHKSQPIIVVCAMGMSAKKTASALLKAGFTEASVLQGGMSAWTSANLPTTK
ncbi:MAG: rhodanese-like domain-containing protein [Glaciecola sp.]|mgnify:FL=1|jgi:rhodanese-related sulfurtransferase|uniref:rhodanese-like domain-containing protein n=1 Tax=Glaciecola sp. HTCC2999 TaxID=455436 RepID=UPI0000E0EEEE|nr:rhodanese-like domain-containing protein [Glaciecola sp. HTCC2999]MCH1413809.1 rhodanese-like domain-containing protein [Glaciecola sp.]